MEIRTLEQRQIRQALPLVWEVFLAYEALDYSESEKEAFYQAIYDEDYLKQLSAYGAFLEERLVGILAMREEGRHVALFFVEGQLHRQGIGRKLWEYMLINNRADRITVHSSLYAAKVYESLGFVQTEEIKKEGNIRFLPMVFKRE